MYILTGNMAVDKWRDERLELESLPHASRPFTHPRIIIQLGNNNDRDG